MPYLDQLLARNLGLSRREARAAIVRGALTRDNGEPWPQPFAEVVAPLVVRWQGQTRTLVETIVVLQHKPVGVVTSREDPRHPTAYGLLRDLPLFAELVAVGRLDLDASGLLLWTNDGSLVHRLCHPKHRVRRTYHVGLARPFEMRSEALTLKDGYVPEIDELHPLEALAVHPALICESVPSTYATITLHAGAYHEVKRIFAALGSHVVGLCRVSQAGLFLPRELAPGSSQILDTHLVAQLG